MQRLFAENYDTVLDVLHDFSWLKDVLVFRFYGTEATMYDLTVEEFRGHAIDTSYEHINARALHISDDLDNTRVFVRLQDEIFTLCPFLHFNKQDFAHLTYFKQRKVIDRDTRYDFQEVGGQCDPCEGEELRIIEKAFGDVLASIKKP